MRSHAKNRIFDFVFAQYPFYLGQGISEICTDILKPIIRALPLLDDDSHEKCTLLILMLHNITRFTAKKEMQVVVEALQKVLKELSPDGEDDNQGQIDSGQINSGAGPDKAMTDENDKKSDKAMSEHRMEMLSCFYNFVCAIQQPDAVQSPQMQQHIEQTLHFVHDNFRDKT